MSNVAWSGTASGILLSRVKHRMQLTVIITQVGLEPPDRRAGSICWKLNSFKSPQTENGERGPGAGQRAIRRRYVYPALADDRPVFTYATTTTTRRRNRRVHSDALQSMQTLLFCPSDCLNALYCAF